MKKLFLSLFVALCFFTSCSDDDNNEETIDTNLPEELNFIGLISSCSDFNVYQVLDIEHPNVVLSISGSSRERLNLTEEFQTFELPDLEIEMAIGVWDQSMIGYNCNDTDSRDVALLRNWQAVSGTISISAIVTAQQGNTTYYTIDLLLENVVFQNEINEEQRTIDRLLIEDREVGWFPG